MLEQVEIASAPQHELDALLDDLRGRRAEAREAAAGRGVRVAALGSSPWPAAPTPTPDERYARMHRHFGTVARDQLSCGLHVHVSIESRAEGVAAIDALGAWLPALIALAANSPFWEGRDTGYASYRRIAWGRFPTAGPTAPFGSPAAYDAAVGDAIGLGGALDVGMIYFDARLSARYPTVELRVADSVQDVRDAVLIAALARALVEAKPVVDAPLGALRAASWQAARYGLTGDLADVAARRLRPAADVLDRLVAALPPGPDRTCAEAGIARLLAAGNGAQAQRADFAAGGAAAVVDAAVGRTA